MTAALAACVIDGTRAPGVILMSTGDPLANTTAPSGALAGSGWQYQGHWGPNLGTAIAPHAFVTARHVGGSPGDVFRFHGRDHVAIEFHDDPEADLRIWRVCDALPTHAPIYLGREEVGKPFVVFGRGTQRGEAVIASDGLRGWKWGNDDGLMRWGQNRFSGIVDLSDPETGNTSATWRNLLRAQFDSNEGPGEAHLSSGDSGGGLFLLEDGEWKLAGIARAADGRYNLSNEGGGFLAAIFDTRGLYRGFEGSWNLVPALEVPQPGAFYASRISTSAPWILQVLENIDANALRLQSAAEIHGPYLDVLDAVVSGTAGTITVPRSGPTRFYRIRSCSTRYVVSMEINEDALIFRYRKE